MNVLKIIGRGSFCSLGYSTKLRHCPPRKLDFNLEKLKRTVAAANQNLSERKTVLDENDDTSAAAGKSVSTKGDEIHSVV